jgi:hypothetical protein
MTGIVIVSSLLPILHSQEMGSEIISKIVAPMIRCTISLFNHRFTIYTPYLSINLQN